MPEDRSIPPFKYLAWYIIAAALILAALARIVALADAGTPSVIPWFLLIGGAAIALAACEEQAEAEEAAHKENLAAMDTEPAQMVEQSHLHSPAA